MRIPGPLHEATVVKRENRFRTLILLNGKKVRAHMANPGRMRELIYPGATVYARPADGPLRRTAWDLVLAKKGRVYCGLDTRTANAMFLEAWNQRLLPEFAAYDTIQPEVTRGRSRFDFLLSTGTVTEGNDSVEAEGTGRTKGTDEADEADEALVEVKSANLVERGRALFPDAPTTRGARHLRELAEHVRAGGTAWVVFVCQRRDAKSVSPHVERDPAFAEAMREAAGAGVGFAALTCRITLKMIEIHERIPVVLDGKTIGKGRLRRRRPRS